jgi:hypothetical protein
MTTTIARFGQTTSSSKLSGEVKPFFARAKESIDQLLLKTPLSQNAEDLKAAYETEVARRPLKSGEVEVLDRASKNWLPPIITTLASAPEQLIVRPERAGSSAAHILTSGSTAIGAGLGGTIPVVATTAGHIAQNALQGIISGLTSLGTGLWNATLGHVPMFHIAAQAHTAAGAAATVVSAKAGVGLSSLGIGIGATTGLGIGLIASLVITPLVALAQHMRNRNVMAVMSHLYNIDEDNKRKASPNMLELRKEGPFGDAYKESRESKAGPILKAFTGGRSLIDL